MIIVSGALILYIWKFKTKEILTYILTSVFIGCLYFVWGFYLSPKLFMDLFITQGHRDFIGSINLLVTLFKVNIYRFPVDGWWIGGFISMLFIPKSKKYLPMGVTIIAILSSALLVVGSNYPWYFIPLVPFMSVAIAIVLTKFAVKPTFISTMFIFFSFVSSSLYWGYGAYQKIQPFNMYRLALILFIAIGSFWFFGKRQKAFQKIWHFGVILLIFILVLLNRRSMFFILENWGKLPLIYTPGTF
jgi:hypothetical protein